MVGRNESDWSVLSDWFTGMLCTMYWSALLLNSFMVTTGWPAASTNFSSKILAWFCLTSDDC